MTRPAPEGGKGEDGAVSDWAYRENRKTTIALLGCPQCGQMGVERISRAESDFTYLHEWQACGHSFYVTSDLPQVSVTNVGRPASVRYPLTQDPTP